MTHERRKEVIGLMLMVLSGLITLALVSYSVADEAIARSIALESILRPSGDRAANLLGPVGAALADLLIPRFIGYFSVLLVGVVFAWGYAFFRRTTRPRLRSISLLLAMGAFLLSATLGWMNVSWGLEPAYISGAWGIAVATWLVDLTGTVGAGGILLLLVAILALLVIQKDIQGFLDRIEGVALHGFASVREHVSEWSLLFRERREERAAAREARGAGARTGAESPVARPPKPAGPGARTFTHDGPKVERGRPEELREPDQANAEFRAASPATSITPHPHPAYPAPVRASGSNARDDALSIVEPEPDPTAEPFDRTAGGSVSVQVQQQVEEAKADPSARPSATTPASLPYRYPPLNLLQETDHSHKRIDYAEIEENNQILLDKLATYSIEITNINAIVGPTVTMYELTPAPGVKISRITALENDLAMAMAARGIRIIAPIPGKSAVGVEIPNRHRELVRVRDIIGTARFQDNHMELPVAIGKAIDGEVFVEDLTKMPHLLIAGATGSGKSVGLNTLIVGLLYACHPANLKFVMIDPKKIELQQYAQIFDHFAAMPPHSEDPIITDFTDALGVLKCCEKEMELRYDLLSDAGVRGIKEYNKKFATGKLDPAEGHRHLPYIVVIVDELADLMMTAGKDIEGPIARLAQMARAIGIHLVLATQRPSVDVITGLIKANFPSRIAYQVASKVDSRTILDQNGAQGLVGNGDLLYMNGSRVVRLQGSFVSVEEVEEVMRFIGDQGAQGPYLLPPFEEEGSGYREAEVLEDTDDLFDEAARIIVRSQQGSVSLLQRRLSVGYTRAARIVDQLEDAGIVGPFEGSKARRVLIENEMDLDEFLASRK